MPNKRLKVNEAKEAERQRREDILAVYEGAFVSLPKPSRASLRKRASIAGALKNPKKKTKLQLAQEELARLRAALGQEAAAGQNHGRVEPPADP